MALQNSSLPADPAVPLSHFAQNDAALPDTPEAVVKEDWQPAHADEKTPLAPPDDVQPMLQGPIPGIDQAIGNCAITGEVSDAVSLNPVAGVFVDVIGTGRTAETDAQRRFTIGGMPAGTFTPEATKLGYFTESTDPWFDSSPFFIGDEYLSFYLVANAHLYQDRMLLMTGLENVILKDQAGGGFDTEAWIWHSGVKASF